MIDFLLLRFTTLIRLKCELRSYRTNIPCLRFSRSRRRCGRPPVRHTLRHVRRLPDAEEGRGLLRPRRAQALARRQLILKGAEQRVLRLDYILTCIDVF